MKINKLDLFSASIILISLALIPKDSSFWLLSKKESVHHINRDKKDNKITNLLLFKNLSEHRQFEGGNKKIKSIFDGSRVIV